LLRKSRTLTRDARRACLGYSSQRGGKKLKDFGIATGRKGDGAEPGKRLARSLSFRIAGGGSEGGKEKQESLGRKKTANAEKARLRSTKSRRVTASLPLRETEKLRKKRKKKDIYFAGVAQGGLKIRPVGGTREKKGAQGKKTGGSFLMQQSAQQGGKGRGGKGKKEGPDRERKYRKTCR